MKEREDQGDADDHDPFRALADRRRSWGESPDPAPTVRTLNALARYRQEAGDTGRARTLWEESLVLLPDQPAVVQALQAATPRYRRASLSID